VLTLGEGVHVFSLDPAIGEFIMTRKGITIPSNPQRIYSINEVRRGAGRDGNGRHPSQQ
jgi:fructose-1,6-bisphosphatase